MARLSSSIPAAAAKVDQHGFTADRFFDDSFSPDAGILRLHDYGTHWAGDYVDYRGIVTVYMEGSHLRLDAVASNRCHVRTWQRSYGNRTVTMLCRAFLSDIHSAPGDRQ